ncbi:MAG: SDR family oxidoreductase [Actinomycetota bacterium]|nr:SDR family oxidoreductase [Actinomycetota bacterium]
MSTGRLAGRIALVTGVSRRAGIGYTVAERLQRLGASVFASGWSDHDAEMPWGADDSELGIEVEQRNLEDPSSATALVDAAVDRYGRLDIVIAVHARSSRQTLAQLTAFELDRCWAANVRSVLLLAQRFAQRHDTDRRGGRMLWFTSGQHIEPMADELPYAVTKGALHQMTASVSDALIDKGIVANCINPGPVDTGYASGAAHADVARRFPGRSWGTPGHVADLIEFLVSDEGEWIQGQVINSEGGFRRWR